MTGRPSPLDSPFGDDVWNVLARYLSRESPPDEVEAVRRWVAGDPRRARLLDTLELALRPLAQRPPANLDLEAAWRRVATRMDQGQAHPMTRKRWPMMMLRAAAVMAIVFGATEVWRRTRVPSSTDGAPAPVTYATAVGETDSVTLPDGSRAVLGPGSRLTLAFTYGIGGRQVQLAGEALFDVVHDVTRPFAVRAAGALITDLGTTFAVRDDGGLIDVMVVSGSVLLQDTVRQKAGSGTSGGGVVLREGERGTLLPTGETRSTRAAWTGGRLEFDNASLSVVAARLRRWYGIELRVIDQRLAGRHLTASFAGEPPSQVLSIIGLALGAQIERRGDTALVRGR